MYLECLGTAGRAKHARRDGRRRGHNRGRVIPRAEVAAQNVGVGRTRANDGLEAETCALHGCVFVGMRVCADMGMCMCGCEYL